MTSLKNISYEFKNLRTAHIWIGLHAEYKIGKNYYWLKKYGLGYHLGWIRKEDCPRHIQPNIFRRLWQPVLACDAIVTATLAFTVFSSFDRQPSNNEVPASFILRYSSYKTLRTIFIVFIAFTGKKYVKVRPVRTECSFFSSYKLLNGL